MTVKMRQIGPCLAAEVEGIDMRKPLSPEDAAAIHGGMDEYAVLVFHDQDIDDEQQPAFRSIPSKGGNTEFADMRAAYDALDVETKAQVEDLICEHSQIFSRQQIGFFELTEEERARFKPVRQRLVRVHPITKRKSLYLASH